MSGREKLPKLVAVHDGQEKLGRRQIPVFVEENLTLVMDVKGSGIVSDGPTLRAKEVEKFHNKWSMLSEAELSASLQITKVELMHVLNQNVPCVGCRRSVERLYYLLLEKGHLTLDPLVVRPDGVITIRQEKQLNPQVLCMIFNQHNARLAKLIENQPKKNKKSARCLLHSLESQRSRPLTPVWRDVWDCMKLECKKAVCQISAEGLHATLENYLRKHRFCGECRTKVLKAYALLVDEVEPSKEKGYVSQLYNGIRRCIDEKEDKKHIHLQPKTEYITKLIGRAEPELLGRERHAKTLEIAQEEVLTCLGICIYERLHRVYMRMREEECTCQVFAAVAVDTLSRSFELAVETKQGISQLELLYAELAREEQQKQIRKEQKKIRRKRKKGKNGEHDGKDGYNDCDEDDDDKDDLDKECTCSDNKNESLTCFNCEQYSSSRKGMSCFDDYNTTSKEKDKLRCTNDVWVHECKCENKENNKENVYKCDRYLSNSSLKKESNGSSSDHSHDCGYSSENNNGCCGETGSLISSLSSSPDGSELACSDTCCHHDTDYISHCRLTYGGNGLQPSLQEMLEDHSDEEDCDCYITPEEVKEFKINSRQVYEKRQELREMLQKRFAQFCVNGPLEVPRLLIQTKYASN